MSITKEQLLDDVELKHLIWEEWESEIKEEDPRKIVLKYMQLMRSAFIGKETKTNPQKKAQELFSSYRFILSLPGAPLGYQKDNIAKQSALYAVTEIIKLGVDVEFWTNVKTEIENL